MSQSQHFTSEEIASEEWRPIRGFEETHEVSNLGRVRRANDSTRARRGTILAVQKSKEGSWRLVLQKDCIRKGFLIRDLVAAAFLEEPPSPWHPVVFVDGNPNNLRATNLRYELLDTHGSHNSPTEEWRPVLGYDGVYEVSSLGRVRRSGVMKGARAGRLRKRYISPRGYYCIVLNRNSTNKTFYVHRLVAEAFLGPRPDGLEVNHIDGNKLNNSPENLEYITRTANMEHAHKNGLLKVGTQRRDAKLNEPLVRLIKLHLKHETPYAVSRRFGLPTSTVGNIYRGTCWKHVKV